MGPFIPSPFGPFSIIANVCSGSLQVWLKSDITGIISGQFVGRRRSRNEVEEDK